MAADTEPTAQPIIDPAVVAEYRRKGLAAQYRYLARQKEARKHPRIGLVRQALADRSLPAELVALGDAPMPSQEEIDRAAERNLEKARRRVAKRQERLARQAQASKQNSS